MSGLLPVFSRRAREAPRDTECATHGVVPAVPGRGERDGCMKCDAGVVSVAAGPGGGLVPRAAAWLREQAQVLELAARLDPAAANAGRMAAQARAMAAVMERSQVPAGESAAAMTSATVGSGAADDAGTADADGAEDGWGAGW